MEAKKLAMFERFELKLFETDAHFGSHPGRCDEDIEELLREPYIRRQLALIDDATLRMELRSYGAWDDAELDSRADNEARILWLACGSIVDDAAGA